MQKFDIQKQKQLTRPDRSSIGELDKKISRLCKKLNKKKNYYTTSSCAGRIILLKSSEKKIRNIFLFRSHDKLGFKKFKDSLIDIGKTYRGRIDFQMTSCILHIACRDLDDAFMIIEKAKLAGWKRSGVMSRKRNMVELHSTENLVFPIMDKRMLLIDDDFLKLIVSESNKKLERVWKKIKHLEKLI